MTKDRNKILQSKSIGHFSHNISWIFIRYLRIIILFLSLYFLHFLLSFLLSVSVPSHFHWFHQGFYSSVLFHISFRIIFHSLFAICYLLCGVHFLETFRTVERMFSFTNFTCFCSVLIFVVLIHFAIWNCTKFYTINSCILHIYLFSHQTSSKLYNIIQNPKSSTVTKCMRASSNLIFILFMFNLHVQIKRILNHSKNEKSLKWDIFCTH